MTSAGFLQALWDTTSCPRTTHDAEIPRSTLAGPTTSTGPILQYIHKLINSIEIPVALLNDRVCHQHVVMITLIFGNRQTNICIEFKELQGGVRATSILCLLGIGLGVGSVLLYKLCTKVLSPAISAARGKKQLKSPEKSQRKHSQEGVLSPETPDSGISTGTTLTDPISSCVVSPDCPAYSDDLAFTQSGLRHRSSHYESPLQQISSPRRPNQFGSQGSNCDPHTYDSLYSQEGQTGASQECLYQRGNNPHSNTLYSSVNSDQGFVSGQLYGRDAVWHGSCDQESLGVQSVPADRHKSHFHPHQLIDPSKPQALLKSDQSFSPVVRSHHDDSQSFCASCCDQSSLCDPELSTHYANYSRTGTYHSTPQTDPDSSVAGRARTSFRPDASLRRNNTHSVCSDLSQYTDLSMRESLVGRGYSVDGGESSSRLGTPFSGVFDDESLVPSSTSNMDQIQQEIRMIREEISDMNEQVHVLSSRDDLKVKDIFMLMPDPMKDMEFNQSALRVNLRRRRSAGRERSCSDSRSCSVSMDGDAEDNSINRRSIHHTGEFIWDYQSDLAFEHVEEASNFVANRPVIGDSSAATKDARIDYDSPSFDHVRKYIESCCNVQYDSSNTTPSPSVNRKNSRVTPKQSRTFNSITDMYIDDNFSEYGGDLSEYGERNQPEGCHGEELNNACRNENGNYPVVAATTVRSENELLHKQLSFNKTSPDCDNNGNPEDPGKALDMDTAFAGLSNRSMCKECGSPSHQPKALVESPLVEDSSCDSVFRSGTSSKSSYSGSKKFCSLDDSRSPVYDNAVNHSNKRPRWEVKNVEPKVNLFEYVEREVKGDSPTAKLVKKGFHQVRSLLGMSHIRPIRGDNYCALRATLYQICVNNYSVLKHLGSLDSILRRLTLFQDPQYSFLHNWNFANRLPYAKESVYERIQECVICFYKHMEALSQIHSSSEREAAFLEVLNFDPEIDLQLLEAIKVFMMLEASDMYDSYCGLGHKRAPVFAWLMYSRESSENPEALFKNHINRLGDIVSAHQVELYLLGHTLGVKIEVVRPSCYGQENFISHYPDDGADAFPKVYLVAEDNRLYHAVMQ